MPPPSARLAEGKRRQTERSNFSAMTGAMYAGIAGLRTHMQNLNVIGHNVANVNTYGYKSQRAVFKTAIYTTLTGGSNGTGTVGGTNPSQIGYGSNVASVDIDMSTGNYAVTGKPTDLYLDGDGFFMVGSKDIASSFTGEATDVNKLTSLTLTRVGNFEFKADGYFANNDGNVVYGFLCTGYDDQGKPTFSDQLVPLRLPYVEKTIQYFNKTTGDLIPNYDPNDPTTLPNGVTQDQVEEREVMEIVYPKNTKDDGNGNTTPCPLYETSEVPVLDDQGQPVVDADGNPVTKALSRSQFESLTVDKKTGLISGTSKDTGEVVVIGCVAVGSVTNPNGVTSIGDNYYKAGPGSGDLTVTILGGNAKEMGINQINSELWQANNAGNANAGTMPEVDGLRPRTSDTEMIPSGLEMSKTDLAQEIANMILTQRGYQANTRIITVTDSMLEELVNMKR